MKIVLAQNAISSLIAYSNEIIKTDWEFFSPIPDDIKSDACLSVLKRISETDYFDICDVDNLMKLHNIHMQKEHKDFLHSMHCINWGDMTQKTKEYIMALIVKYLEYPLTKQKCLK